MGYGNDYKKSAARRSEYDPLLGNDTDSRSDMSVRPEHFSMRNKARPRIVKSMSD